MSRLLLKRVSSASSAASNAAQVEGPHAHWLLGPQDKYGLEPISFPKQFTLCRDQTFQLYVLVSICLMNLERGTCSVLDSELQSLHPNRQVFARFEVCLSTSAL